MTYRIQLFIERAPGIFGVANFRLEAPTRSFPQLNPRMALPEKRGVDVNFGVARSA